MKQIFLKVFLSPSFLEGRSFDNFGGAASEFDPAFSDVNGFDPDYFEGKGANSNGMNEYKKREAYFDLTMVNSTASAKGFELFNFLRSFTKKRRTDLTGIATPFFYIPSNSIEGMSLMAGGGDGTVGFNQDGDLVILGGTAVAAVTPANLVQGADGRVQVSCNQFPYQGLFESSANVPFRISRIRATYTTAAQIDREITLARRSFLGGISQNAVNPRTFFKPEQFQALIVDIPINWNIDAESGIEYVLEAGETVKWNVIIEQYEKVQVR